MIEKSIDIIENYRFSRFGIDATFTKNHFIDFLVTFRLEPERGNLKLTRPEAIELMLNLQEVIDDIWGSEVYRKEE